jgi:hypothetical protein
MSEDEEQDAARPQGPPAPPGEDDDRPRNLRGAAIVPRPAPGPIETPGRLSRVLLNANRGVTFGFLLGYLSLAVHGTLEYPRYARYYVGPWVEPAVRPESDEVEYWTKTVARHLAYSAEMRIGSMAAVLSDGAVEPRWILDRLGDTDPNADPPRRVIVRTRLPRVDLILTPEPGCAIDLFEFAHEVMERFNRQLD